MCNELAGYLTLDDIRDRVVALCGTVEGRVVLDVGCGDGLVGRALVPRVGPSGKVIFADHDPDVLAGIGRDLPEPQVATHRCDAHTLAGIDDASVDLVVMRAVLLYLPDKAAALTAAARVLRPGGLLVVSEPVNRHTYERPGWLWGYDLRAIQPIATKIRDAYLDYPAPEVRAMTDWTEQDIFAAAQEAGFDACRMHSVTASFPSQPLPWLAFLHARWTPWMPTVAQVTRAVLTEPERAALERTMRPLVEGGRYRPSSTNLFLTGRRVR